MALDISISLSEETLEKAKRLAKQKNKKVTEVLGEHLERTLPDATDSDLPPEWENAKKVWLRIHPELVNTYLGKYVAIVDEKVVDYDQHRSPLYIRVKEKYPNTFFFTRLVTIEAEPVLRSGRLQLL
ncbi:MAG: DUF5678 domain-containing protein [Chloroflexota bacterium]